VGAWAFDPVLMVVLIPLLSAPVLALLPNYKVSARINVLAFHC